MYYTLRYILRYIVRYNLRVCYANRGAFGALSPVHLCNAPAPARVGVANRSPPLSRNESDIDFPVVLFILLYLLYLVCYWIA